MSTLHHSCAVFPTSSGVIRIRRRPQKQRQASLEKLHDRRPSGDNHRELSYDRLRNVFHLPICKAAKHLNVGITVLKKYCRWYCIERWPYRKIQSVDKLLAVLKDLQATTTTEEVVNELMALRGQLLDQPSLDLDSNIRRLRQSVFKWQYKQRH